MEIKSYKIQATIPTGQYANIQPSIEMEGDSIDEMSKVGLDHIKGLFSRYSELSFKEQQGVVSESIQMRSFNEKDVVVDFDSLAHKYVYNGKVFESASDFVKKHTKPFNATLVSKNCEKSWGVPATDIAKMWNSNGTLAASFGDVVHSALEHWIKFGSNGNTIMESTKKDVNPALPKHPFLKTVIEDFIKVAGVGEFYAEVFVTDVNGGRCGQIDRLKIIDKTKKICRVQDYKVNVNSEDISSENKLAKPFNELPANKLSKYQVQLSYYADILKKSGWTVEGLDVYVYEDTWKHYQLSLLEI